MSIDTPKVSIVTLLGERNSFIPLLKYCVKHQSYPSSHMEWIILDDSNHDRSKEFDLEIATYIKVFKKLNLGRKRQIACDIAAVNLLCFLMMMIFILVIELKYLLKSYKKLVHDLFQETLK